MVDEVVEAAMAEAYAAVEHDAVFINTLVFEHPSFPEPINVASGDGEDADAEAEPLMLPLKFGEEPVEFRRDISFKFIPPGVDEDGPTAARLSVYDPAASMTEYLVAATQGSDSIKVTYRRYRSTDLTRPGEYRPGLVLTSVRQTSEGSEGTINYPEVTLRDFPNRLYGADYPTLQDLAQ